MIRAHRTKGFTIVELSLAMTFVSMLLLAIAMTAIQAGSLYNKGLVLESVNQAGRDIGDMLRRDFMQANAVRISKGDDPSSAVIWLKKGGQLYSGRVCLGGYSYLWNAPAVLNGKVSSDESTPVVRRSGKLVNFVRVVDEGGILCTSVDRAQPTVINPSVPLVGLLDDKGNKGVVLAIHSLDVRALIYREDNAEAIYGINYTIGTSETDEMNGVINTADQSCKPPSDSASNNEFCAINQFEMIVRTNG